MSWGQFLEPQVLIGLGAFAAGVLNAYIQQRMNRQADEPQQGEGEDQQEQQGNQDEGEEATVTEERHIPTLEQIAEEGSDSYSLDEGGITTEEDEESGISETDECECQSVD